MTKYRLRRLIATKIATTIIIIIATKVATTTNNSDKSSDDDDDSSKYDNFRKKVATIIQILATNNEQISFNNICL